VRDDGRLVGKALCVALLGSEGQESPLTGLARCRDGHFDPRTSPPPAANCWMPPPALPRHEVEQAVQKVVLHARGDPVE
jgi:hypothetical protein